MTVITNERLIQDLSNRQNELNDSFNSAVEISSTAMIPPKMTFKQAESLALKTLKIPKDSILADNQEFFHAGVNLYCSLVKVTQEMALNWLLNNNAGNRSVNTNYSQTITRSINANSYALTHEGISFTKDGLLLDGQTRLLALVEAKPGHTINILVTINVAEEAWDYINQGRPRNSLVFREDGFSPSKYLNEGLKRTILGAELRPINLNLAEIKDLIISQKGLLNFLDEAFPVASRRITSAGVMGAFGRAWMKERNTESREKLLHAAHKLMFDDVEINFKADKTIDNLYEWLVQNKDAQFKGGRMYLVVANALASYLQGKVVKTIICRPEMQDPFPHRSYDNIA